MNLTHRARWFLHFGGIERRRDGGTAKPTAKRAEKFDDFKGYIIARMSAASPPRIPAAVLAAFGNKEGKPDSQWASPATVCLIECTVKLRD